MSASDEISLDLEELNRLRQLATRPHVKDLLANEALKLQSAVGKQTGGDGGEPSSDIQPMVVASCTSNSDIEGTDPTVATVKTEGATAAVPLAVSKTAPPRYYKDIMTYAWDQSEKFMKIYVTLNGVQKLPKEAITCEYTAKSFRLKIENLNGLNYSCHVAGLWGKIVPDQCYYKVKSDSVLVMLKKAEEKKTWAFVTEREDKKKKYVMHTNCTALAILLAC
jgi:calcyclin binding protein